SFRGQEGLFFLRSDANSKLVCRLGNVLTDFKFHKADVEVSDRKIQVVASGASADVELGTADQTELERGSPFQSLDEAACALKYKPAALTVRNGNVRRLAIRRDESVWQSRLASV